MRAWAYMLGGLLLWAAHFFGLYIIASVFLTSDLSRVLAAALTIVLLAADVMLLRRAFTDWRGAAGDSVAKWRHRLALLAAAGALVAIAWQGLPALLV